MYLTQALHRNAQQQPSTLATVCEDRTVTWEQSRDRVSRLAAGLRELGVGGGDRVALLALNSDLYHEILLATWWIGAITVPVNTRWSAGEIAYCLDDARPAVLVVDDAFTGMLAGIRDKAALEMPVLHCGREAAPAGLLPYAKLLEHHGCPDWRVGNEAPAGIFYTGGTTGFPKGVVLSHANLLTSAMGMASAVPTPGGPVRLLHAAPMFHLADLGSWITRNLLGGTHVIIPSFTPAATVDAIDRHHVTDAMLVPTMIQQLVDHPETSAQRLCTLERLFYGGSSISPAVLSRLQSLLPDLQLVQAYGMTELAPVATILQPRDHADPVLRTSAGRAAPHTEIRILDAMGQDTTEGGIGEIAVRGGNAMLGYWNKPEQTRQTLQEGWVHTGDVGRLDGNGYLYVVDRLKDMIVTGGENVYSTEVENAVATHPSVLACSAISLPDDTWGEIVHVAIVLRPDVPRPTLEAIRTHTRTSIASYKAPRSISFETALPVSPAGKVLKTTLREQLTRSSTQEHASSLDR